MNVPAFWSSRTPGERAVIGTVAAVCAALLLFAFAWLPADRARSRIAADLPQLRASVAEMRAQALEVKALRALPSREAGAAVSLGQLLASGTLTQGLPGAKLAVLDGKRMKLSADDASWTRLVEWLSTANALHGLGVEEARVEALAAAGRVRAEIVLSAP